MRVQPRGLSLASSLPNEHRHRHGLAILGAIYIGLSTASCIWYLSLLNPSFANDIWWAKYSPSGTQALVVDLFNTRLVTQGTGSLDILAPVATMDKTYETAVATTDIYPTYVRRLLLSELTSLEFAVINLRSLSASWSVFMCSQYCWVDLTRQFEVAHTADRQQRCYDRYHANGAVYLETVLRNQVWADFISTNGGDDGGFTVAIQNWLDQLPAGQTWLKTTSTARDTTNVDQEVAYWRARNISLFQLQWQNRGQTGISESLVIQNALGHTWTSVSMYWLFVNDMGVMVNVNRSLIRSANNSFLMSPFVEMESMLGLQDSN
ncbi:hypothetical protein As57867_000780, partial [Aphanomyces stellatus]